MGSIPKIVSTPLKWVSNQVINKTLLQFPGGDPQSPVACVYCPEMCRFSCPTAVVSGNDAVTPCNKMGLLYKEKKWPGKISQGESLWPIYDCTGCGRCTEYCVYEMPVTQRLFEARKTFKWDRAQEIAATLTDELDPVGDLADELGDGESALRRLKAFAGKAASPLLQVSEPRSLYFLIQNGFQGTWIGDSQLKLPLSSSLLDKLSGKTWLLHESVWLNRHLKRAQDLDTWFDGAVQAGAKIKRPFEHGRDCIDCGGEGAFSRLFPAQAKQMALEIWERDGHHVDGILCTSLRCAEHFRQSLGDEVSIVTLLNH